MRTIAIRRQGTCLTQILIAFALIGVLIFIVGIVSMATSEAGKGIADLQTQIKALTDRATVFEAPASIEVELEKGGGTKNDTAIPLIEVIDLVEVPQPRNPYE